LFHTNQTEVLTMNVLKLTDTELWTAINALRTAAEAYTADADAEQPDGLTQQFKDQATVANALADKLEEAQS
jgi:hypothetical protein